VAALLVARGLPLRAPAGLLGEQGTGVGHAGQADAAGASVETQ
jgi:hypothetical protein